MKKLGVLVLTFLLSFGLVIQPAAASQVTESTESTEETNSSKSTESLEDTESTESTDSLETTTDSKASKTTNFDEDLDLYLSQISFERGFSITREDIEVSLSYFYESMDNFTTVNELSSFLGEVIKSDYSNLDSIYSAYDLDFNSLTALLGENGEELSDYIYLQELNAALYFYTENIFERDPDFDQNFDTYLAAVSKERGFEVTKEDIEEILSEYETSTKDFETVEQLSDFLGEVIKKDLSNLDYIYDTYELDEEAFDKLLSDNEKVINDFIFISDIETFIWTTEYNNDYEAYIQQFSAFLDEIGITKEELSNLENYFTAMEDYLSTPEITEELNDLMERMLEYAYYEDDTIPTEAQINDIISIYKDLLSILKLDIKYTLITNGKQTVLTLDDLAHLTEDDLKGADIKVAIYGEDVKLLADLILTSEMLGNGEITDVLEDTVTTLDKHVSKNLTSTVKGGQLPTTASAYLPNAIWGLFIVFAGILISRKVKAVKDGTAKEE